MGAGGVGQRHSWSTCLGSPGTGAPPALGFAEFQGCLRREMEGASNPSLLQVGSLDQQQQLGFKPHGPPTERETGVNKVHSDLYVHCWRRATLVLCFPDLSDVKDHREGLSKIQILTLKLTQIINQLLLLLLLFSCSVLSDSLRPHELQHAKLPCPSPSPRVGWLPSPSHPMSPPSPPALHLSQYQGLSQ